MQTSSRHIRVIAAILMLTLGLVNISFGSNNNYIGQDIPKSLHTPISVNLRDVPLEKALDVIAGAAGIKLNFNRDRLGLDKKVTVVQKDTKAIMALSQVLDQSDATLKFTGEGQIAVVPASANKSMMGVISGKIFDATTGEELIGASIELIGYNRGAVSDVSGDFSIPKVHLGSYSLKIRCIGYQTQIVEQVIVRDESPVDLNISLAQQPLELDQVTVTPGTFAIMESESSVQQSLSRDDIETVSQMGEDIYRAVNRLPGLSSGDFSAQFKVRGGEHDEVLVLLDGMELHEPFHVKDINQGALSIIDAEAVEGIDLMTGGFTSEYGNRLSGVFNINTRKPEKDLRTYSVGISMMNMRLMSEGSFANNKGSWLLSARRGYLDIVLDMMNEKDAPKPKYYDVLFRSQYQLNPKHTLAYGVLHAGDELTEEDSDESDFLDSNYGNSYIWLSMKSLLNSKLYTNSIVSFGRITDKRYGYDPHYMNAGRFWYKVDDDRSFNLVNFKQNWQYELNDNFLLKWGVDTKQMSSDYNYYSYRLFEEVDDSGYVVQDSVINNLDFAKEGTYFGGYLSNRIKIIEPLVVELGARYDWHSYSKDKNFSPRINGMFKLADKTFFRWGWGKFYQAQGLNELSVGDGESEYGKAELSEQWTLGFERLAPYQVHLRVEGYYKKNTKLRPSYRNWFLGIEFFPEIEDERMKVFLNSKTSKGIEIYARRDVGNKFSFWTSYALAYAEDEINQIEFAEGSSPAPYSTNTPSPNDQRHTIYADFNYRPHPTWTLNMSWTYHTGWPYTDRIISAFTSPRGAYLQSSPDSLNGKNFPAYQRLNMRITKRFITKSGQFKVFLELINIYNHDNVYAYEWNDWYLDNQGVVRYTKEAEHWFHFLPSIGISWSGRF